MINAKYYKSEFYKVCRINDAYNTTMIFGLVTG